MNQDTWFKDNGVTSCPACKGRTWVRQGGFMNRDMVDCPDCHGTGISKEHIMIDHTRIIEDEAEEAYGMTYDQVQADYHRIYELGVNDGTHAALFDKGQIVTMEFFHENDRSRHILDSILPESYESYWDGYHAAYANTCRPEVLSCFEGGTWSERHGS